MSSTLPPFSRPALAIAAGVIAALAAGGCATHKEKPLGTHAQRAAELAGQWVSPTNPNHYLVFTADSQGASQGRLLGHEPYETYRIAGFNSRAPRLELELTSHDDFWEQHTAQASILFDATRLSITATLPPATPGAESVTRVYQRNTYR